MIKRLAGERVRSAQKGPPHATGDAVIDANLVLIDNLVPFPKIFAAVAA
jgi:hypothetical protein